MIFPCDFSLKVMGLVEADLAKTLLPVLQQHIPGITAANITSRLSKAGNYEAITINFTAQSREQLDALYRELSARPDVQMVL